VKRIRLWLVPRLTTGPNNIMLETLRKSATGWVAKIFIGLLVISFAIWGIADIFRGYGATTVATVGETEIPAEQFQFTYNREMRALGQRLRRPITAQEAAAVGLPSQVLTRMVSEATLNEEARRLKLGLSDETLAKEVRSDPNLLGPDGTFDRERFREILLNNGMNEDFYLAESRSFNMRRQLSEAVVGGFQTPDAYLEAFNRFMNEQRTVDYVLLDAASVDPLPEPREEELTTFFLENKADFRAPEYRKLSILDVSPAAVARPDEITEDEVKQAFEAEGSKYVTPEKRTIRQIVFPSPDDAARAAENLSGGMSFDEIITQRGLSAADVDLGTITKAEVIDPAVAEAAFGMTAPGVSDVIAGRFGSLIIQVTEIQPESRTAIDEVRETIKKELAEKKAESEVLQIHDEVEDARAGGATLAEIAERFKIPLRAVEAVDSTSKDMSGNPVDLPAAADLLKAAFDSDVGIENDPLQQARGFLWYEVGAVTPARERTLDEARDKVVAAWREAKRDSLLGEKITGLMKQVEDGAELATIAAELGTEVKTATELKRNAPKDGLDLRLVNAAFQGPEGYRTSVKLSDGSRAILQVKEVTAPVFFAEAEETAPLRQELDTRLVASLLNQYVTQLQKELGVKINQTTVARTIGLTANQ